MKNTGIFQHPAAVEILKSSTSDADKIRALRQLSSQYSDYSLARYFGYTEVSVSRVINKNQNSLVPQSIHPDDIKKPLPVGKHVISISEVLQINYV